MALLLIVPNLWHYLLIAPNLWRYLLCYAKLMATVTVLYQTYGTVSVGVSVRVSVILDYFVQTILTYTTNTMLL